MILGDPRRGIASRQAQELALARSHETTAQAIFRPRVPGIVAMVESVQEYLDAILGPRAQAACKSRSRDDRSIAPMVGDDQHREPVTDMFAKLVHERIDLVFEARRNVMY